MGGELADEALNELVYTEGLDIFQALVVLCQCINQHLEVQKQSLEESD